MKRIDTPLPGLFITLVLGLSACGGQNGDDTIDENPDVDVENDAGDTETDAGDSDPGDTDPGDSGDTDSGDTDGDTPDVLYSVSVTVEGTGSGTLTSDPAGLDCSESCDADLPAGEVTLSVELDEGSEFVEWAGDCSGSENPLTLSLSSPIACRAVLGLTPPRSSWTRSYGEGGTHEFRDLALVGDGSIIAVGYSSMYGAGEDEAIIARIDEEGELIWQKSIGDAGTSRLSAIVATGEGDFIAAGESDIESTEYRAIWALRINADGEVLWQNAYQRSSEIPWHERTAFAHSIQALDDDQFLIGGSVTGAAVSSSYDTYMGALTIDGDGALLGHSIYPLQSRRSRGVHQLSDGGLVFAGASHSAGTATAYLVRTNADGTTAWRIGDEARYGFFERVIESDAGSIIAVGTALHNWSGGGDHLLVMKIDAAGEILWQRRFGKGGSDGRGRAVLELDDGRIVAVGSVRTEFRIRAWVLVLDANGDVVVEHSFAGADGTHQIFENVEVDDQGRVYLVGSTDAPHHGEGGYESGLVARLESVDAESICEADTPTNYYFSTTNGVTTASDTEVISPGMFEEVPDLDVVDISMANNAMCGG